MPGTELLAPLGCGVTTGAGAVLNAFEVGAGSSITVFGTGAVGMAAVMAGRAATIIGVDVNRLRPRTASLKKSSGSGRGLDVAVYSGATAAGELHEGSEGCEQHRSAAVRSSASALMSRIWEIPNADMGMSQYS